MNKWDLMLQNKLKKESIDLQQLVTRCCFGLKIDPRYVVDRMLSVEDEQDIINGLIPVDTLILHIKIWYEIGMPHYSGKSLARKSYIH